MKFLYEGNRAAITPPPTKPITMGCWTVATKDGDFAYRTTLQVGTYKKTFEGIGKGTHQCGSLQSLVTALRALKKGNANIRLFTTSQYLHDNLIDIKNMKARKWRNRIGGDIAYSEVWQEVYALLEEKCATVEVIVINRKDDRMIEPMQRLSALAKHEAQPILMEVSRK